MQSPGWKTSEFYMMAAAVIVGLLIASGLVSDASSFGKVLALAASTLASLGYSASRTVVKKNARPALEATIEPEPAED